MWLANFGANLTIGPYFVKRRCFAAVPVGHNMKFTMPIELRMNRLETCGKKV
jgi:hypothetical protein